MKNDISQGKTDRDDLNGFQPQKTYRLSSSGFTLVEILIAMAIFSIGILGVAKMQIAGIGGNASARVLTDTVVQAADQIELLMLLPYDHADLTQGTHVGVALDGYTLVWNVIDNSPVPDSKKITMTVTPTGINSAKSITIEQVKSEIN